MRGFVLEALDRRTHLGGDPHRPLAPVGQPRHLGTPAPGNRGHRRFGRTVPVAQRRQVPVERAAVEPGAEPLKRAGVGGAGMRGGGPPAVANPSVAVRCYHS